MKLTRLASLLVLGLVAGSLVVWRVYYKTDAPDSQAPAGGRLVATLRSEPRSFNRLVSPMPAEELISRLTQDTLVRVNRVTDALEPRLARSWTTSPDGLTWTLALEPNVTFSDRIPFTSADVLFAFQAVYDSRVGSPLASDLEIGGARLSVRAADAMTVVITFPAPYGPGLRLLDGLPILPRHKLLSALDNGSFKTAWGLTTPPADLAGLGPFVLQQYVPGQRLLFSRNPRFWRKDEQGRPLPYLDTLEIQIVPDQNAELLRLQAGETDLTSDSVRPEDLASLRRQEADGRVRLASPGVSPSADGLWFNLGRGARMAKDRPWLQKEELRRAISHAVNRQTLVDTVYLGAAVPIFGPVTPGHGEWYLPDLARTDHDPALAGRLLASIGLADRTGDGMLEDERGKPARFSILTVKGHSLRERAVSILQEDLRKVGLTVDVVSLDAGGLFARYSKADYDAIYFYVTPNSIDPVASVEFWLSSGSFHFWNPGQPKPATEWEAKIDDLVRRQSTSLDRQERVRLFAEAQRTLAAHLPIVYFVAPRVMVAMGARVGGAAPSVLWPPVLWNAEALSVSPEIPGRAARQ